MKMFGMKTIAIYTFAVCIAAAGCDHGIARAGIKADEEITLTHTYGNETFSIKYPDGWRCHADNWKGPDSARNNMHIVNEADSRCVIRAHRAYYHFDFKSVAEAAELIKYARFIEDQDKSIEIYSEHDSLEIGGLPAYLITFVYLEGNDTIMDNQFIAYDKVSRTTLDFNAQCNLKNFDSQFETLNEILNSIVVNKESIRKYDPSKRKRIPLPVPTD